MNLYCLMRSVEDAGSYEIQIHIRNFKQNHHYIKQKSRVKFALLLFFQNNLAKGEKICDNKENIYKQGASYEQKRYYFRRQLFYL